MKATAKKTLEIIEQNHLEKHNSLEDDTLKLKKILPISESHLPKMFEKSSPKPNKSNIKIKFFLTNTRTPVDSFIDNLFIDSRRERNFNTPCNTIFYITRSN